MSENHKFTTRSGRCFIMAEVAQAHDGSLGTAHVYIDAVAQTGADAIKFQTHIADAESTPAEAWRVKFSPQDNTRFDYWKRMEFSAEQWAGLKEHAEQAGLVFLSSPFSIEAVQLLDSLGISAWKIASGEVGNRAFFDEILRTKKPVLLSTGMSGLAEIDQAVQLMQEHDIPLTVLQCTSMYPTPAEKVGLNLLGLFKERYGCTVGLSDHSGSIFPGLAAVTLGITVLEVHVAFSRETFGPDVTSSLTTGELKQLVEGVRMIEKIQNSPVDKDLLARELEPMRKLFNKSVVARKDLIDGTVLKLSDLTVKKPGSGIPASQLADLVGRKVKHLIRHNSLLLEDDLE